MKNFTKNFSKIFLSWDGLARHFLPKIRVSTQSVAELHSQIDF